MSLSVTGDALLVDDCTFTLYVDIVIVTFVLPSNAIRYSIYHTKGNLDGAVSRRIIIPQ